MPEVLVLQPRRREFDRIQAQLGQALAPLDITMLRVDRLHGTAPITEQMYEALEAADVVIADVTGMNPNVLYELGYAHGVRRPVILMSADAESLPFDLWSVRYLHYSFGSFEPEPLVGLVQEALARPARFTQRPQTRPDVNRVFLSYSHRDADILERLLVHLRPLAREGLIDVWSDRDITAGSDWKADIERALDHARAAVLLVSADFLASDFIVDNELPPLLKGAEKRGSLIVPVIVKPCRYLRDPNLARLQAINDPARPLAALPLVEQEQLLDDVGALVERAMRPVS